MLLVGCGSTTKSQPTKNEATAGTANGGGHANGGAEDAGSPSGGFEMGGSGTSGSASAGAGGKLPDFPGGAPSGPLTCTTAYEGPTGGPRGDGPIEELNSCTTIPEPIVLARYKNFEARVPRGLYYEPVESITFWQEPCAKSEQELVDRGPTDNKGTFLASYSNEWFYEAVYCFNDSVRRIERSLRCDYFDGSKLANPTPERLAFLASQLWWAEHYNEGGAAILGHAVTIGNATDVVDLCTISATIGDFGLCDEVRVENTKYVLSADGTVKLGTPEVIRTLKGDCH